MLKTKSEKEKSKEASRGGRGTHCVLSHREEQRSESPLVSAETMPAGRQCCDPSTVTRDKRLSSVSYISHENMLQKWRQTKNVSRRTVGERASIPPADFLCEPFWEDPQTVENNAQWEVRRHRGTRSYRIRKYEGNSSERKGGPRGRRADQPTGVEGAGREWTQRMVQRKE